MTNVQSSLPRLCDAHSRGVSYLRFSVTDRCNLRCVYCRGLGKESVLPHGSLLRYEEILRLVRVFRGLGVGKVRLTGGEPFARRDCAALIMSLRSSFPDLNLRLTSNGTLLRPHIGLLKEARVDAVNLSIDSFDRETFRELTGFDLLDEVVAVLEGLLAAGVRVKVNAVAMRGVTDRQLPSFLEAVTRWPVDVRFIEFMPMGEGTVWDAGRFLPAEEIMRSLGTMAELVPVPDAHADHGPARMYAVPGRQGRFGFITALSNHFCDTCNRLRVTSDGSLRTCLFADTMTPLRGLLRDPAVTDEDLARVIRQALADKPVGADLLKARKETAVARGRMASIGG
ncbi:MAG: GTP 3',8-cyclase MoaA [Desulfovibrionaceae bacterium]|nr:GTP 3',8-cyclase MoaA [Desulfovibrionaceae bacterium]